MTESMLISSTKNGIGKTGIALALALMAEDKGLDVGYMKPKGVRLRSSVGKILDRDALLAQEILRLEEDVDVLEPIVYSADFIEGVMKGEETPRNIREQVSERYSEIGSDKDLVVIDGSGGYSTGEVIGLSDPEMADELDAELLLVTGYSSVFDVDDILVMANKTGKKLSGVLFNQVPDSEFDEVESLMAPYLEGKGIDVNGIIPREKEIAAITISDLAMNMNAEEITNIESDAYIERFIVGAMSAESALRQFRRTKDAVVVTGGDRPDIQRAAIDAPGVKCLLVTGGMSPPGPIVSQAEKEGVHILGVQSETLSAINDLEELIHKGRTPSTETVNMLIELMKKHTDLESLLPD